MMELLEKMADYMEDEIGDVMKYIEEAKQCKESELSDVFYQISLQEGKHYEILLEALSKIMNRESTSAEEKAVYEFIRKHLKKSYDRATRTIEEFKQS